MNVYEKDIPDKKVVEIFLRMYLSN